MSFHYTKNVKLCVTCALWGGNRILKGGGIIEVSSTADKGKCQGGAYNNAMMATNSQCNKWEKWAPLR